MASYLNIHMEPYIIHLTYVCYKMWPEIGMREKGVPISLTRARRKWRVTWPCLRKFETRWGHACIWKIQTHTTELSAPLAAHLHDIFINGEEKTLSISQPHAWNCVETVWSFHHNSMSSDFISFCFKNVCMWINVIYFLKLSTVFQWN